MAVDHHFHLTAFRGASALPERDISVSELAIRHEQLSKCTKGSGYPIYLEEEIPSFAFSLRWFHQIARKNTDARGSVFRMK